VRAQKSSNDARVEELKFNANYMYEMDQITKSGLIEAYEGIKQFLIPGTRQFKELELEIKRLRDETSADLQANLPQNLQLPTLYEVRRLSQTGADGSVGPNGTPVGYQDNRNVQVTVYVTNGMTETQVIDTFSQALNVGTTGVEPGRY
jgi:hypothetical protein